MNLLLKRLFYCEFLLQQVIKVCINGLIKFAICTPPEERNLISPEVILFKLEIQYINKNSRTNPAIIRRKYK